MPHENSASPVAQPPPLPPALVDVPAAEQPPVQAPQLPPPLPGLRQPGFTWWARTGKVTRRLGHLLENWRLEIRARIAGFSLSMAIHAAIFVALSLIMIPAPRRAGAPAMQADFAVGVDTAIAGSAAGPQGVAFVAAAVPRDKSAEPPPASVPNAVPSSEPPPAVPVAAAETTAAQTGPSGRVSQASDSDAAGAATAGQSQATTAPAVAPATSPAASQANVSGRGDGVVASATAGGLEGRDPAVRGQMLARFGGTPSSEAAVNRGLRWLVQHQLPDGSWHFNHHSDSCRGYCGNPGSFASTTAATGLALLPFLGAGNTHLAGEHREPVRKGIYYLAEKMIVGDQGGDLQEGSMYSQGIATIALCEAYAMSKDAALRPYAQAALDFIVHGQDQTGGGWRYAPLQPGDTTVTGWQLMALKSGLLGGLNVPPSAFGLTSHFLDGVQSDYGAGYGYQKPGRGPTTTAVGVLARMLTLWRRDRPDLMSGVRRLERLGPSKTEMYFNYYATQVLRHNGGPAWDRWNKIMREQLIASQATVGHSAGSWYVEDQHAEVGGRLYITCMAIMTLEVYYRYMPLYGSRAVE
jgi:hypothetical protein